jgi:hypothetical protein
MKNLDRQPELLGFVLRDGCLLACGSRQIISFERAEATLGKRAFLAIARFLSSIRSRKLLSWRMNFSTHNGLLEAGTDDQPPPVKPISLYTSPCGTEVS